MQGKGIYIWILKRCGDMQAVVNNLRQAGMTHVIPKIADGTYSDVNGNWSYLPSFVSLCHKAGIKVLGYHYVYGVNGEAQRAIIELKKLPFDGLVINAEHQYRDNPNNKSLAKAYCDQLKSSLPDMKLALSTYRFPTLHAKFPYREFLNYCDWNMPQVYWMSANGTVPSQLARTISEYKAYPQVPMIPTGAAFAEHGWKAIAADQKIFVAEAKKHGLSGCNWWEYYEAFHRSPELGQAIIEAEWNTPIPPPVEPPPGGDIMYIIEMLGNMNIRDKPNGVATGQYALTGEVYHSNERSADNWYKIDKGWISGNTQYTRITQETEPEPVQPTLTLEERVKRLEDKVFGE